MLKLVVFLDLALQGDLNVPLKFFDFFLFSMIVDDPFLLFQLEFLFKIIDLDVFLRHLLVPFLVLDHQLVLQRIQFRLQV